MCNWDCIVLGIPFPSASKLRMHLGWCTKYSIVSDFMNPQFSQCNSAAIRFPLTCSIFDDLQILTSMNIDLLVDSDGVITCYTAGWFCRHLTLSFNLCQKSWNTWSSFKTVCITSPSPPQYNVDLRKIYT